MRCTILRASANVENDDPCHHSLTSKIINFHASAENEMAILAKETRMPLDKRLVDRETSHGTAFWADVRARLANKH